MINKKLTKSAAFKFVVLLGIVSLFSDMVYEGARSITGPYLGLLGASGAIVGFVAGFGELVGNALRIVTGYLVDRTAKYWFIAFLGYLCNFVAIPLLAFTTNWQAAAALIIFERVGKAIRVPSRDAMLSYATHEMGRGVGFGLHQVLDQFGGMLGPAIIAVVLFLKHDYRLGFIFLTIPALFSLSMLLIAKKLYPHPQELEVAIPELSSSGIPRLFWIYLVAAGLVAAGYADFPLIAFHFQKESILSPYLITIYYVIAMGASAVSALLFGRLYDRNGCAILMVAILLSAFFAPLVFLGYSKAALLGMIVWGVGMGAQRSLLKAVVGDMVSKKIRGSAYGIFNTGYGIAWFLGSWLMGVLYDASIFWLIGFSVFAQLSAIPFIYVVQKKLRT